MEVRRPWVAAATIGLLWSALTRAAFGDASAAAAVDISARPDHVFVGEPFTLSWRSPNRTECAASGAWSGPLAVAGSEAITPTSDGTKTYTITCEGPNGSKKRSATVRVSTPSLTYAVAFSPNSTTISTSEGAPYGFCQFWVQLPTDCSHQTNFGYGPTKILQLYICLSGEVSTASCSQQPAVTGPLSHDMLKAMDDRLSAYAGTGMRLLLRFTYNFGPIGPGSMDAPIDVIATHIDQIAPIVRRHKDLIFALEAGFIGTWGEWHDSTSGNDNAAAHKVVLDKELAHFRGLFPILVRDPGGLVEYTGSLVPEPGLGIHDDYYASNVNDAATWVTCAPRSGFCLQGYTTDQMESYGAQIATTTMFAGEFGAVYAPLENCSSLSAYSYTYHPQSISLHPYPPDVATFLAGEGCAADFYNRVGTRIVLQNVNVIGNAVPGGRLYVTAQMVNDGYGRVIRRRPAMLVFLQDGIIVGRHEISTAELDLRTLQSAAIPTPVTFGFEVKLPTQLHPGSVLLALLFSDPAPSLQSQPAYALPLNSLGPKGNSIFDVATGVNGIARFDIY